jgi:hypothetical protein
VDLAPVDPDLGRIPDPVGDVRRRHRAEERPGRAGVHVEAELGLLQRGGDPLRLLDRLGVVPRAQRLAALELVDLRLRRHLGQPPRQQVVAGIPARDVDHVAAQAELLDVLQENDLHQPDT